MRMLIATAGGLSPDPVAQFAERLVGPDGWVRVITVIEVPRSFLDEIRGEGWHPLSDAGRAWSSEEDALIARYVEERGPRPGARAPPPGPSGPPPPRPGPWTRWPSDGGGRSHPRRALRLVARLPLATPLLGVERAAPPLPRRGGGT